MAKKLKVTPSSTQPVDNSTNNVAESGHVTIDTPFERAKKGKKARLKSPRSGHAGWDLPAGRPDPIDLLEEQARTRLPELVPIRYGRMLASPFAFYRGAVAIMASDLAGTPQSGLRAQLCGDAHLANFGGFASPERELVFDINDFDETLPGPWEWDVKRLITSFEIAGRERGFNAGLRRTIMLTTAGEYRRAMREFAAMHTLDVWYALLDPARIQARWGASGSLKGVKQLEADLTLSHSHTRDNMRAFEKLTHRVDGELKIVSRPPLIVPVEELFPDSRDLSQFEQAMQRNLRVYRQSLAGDRCHLLEQFRYVHMARKVVGVGSVGTHAWIVLLLGPDDEDALFLQFKEAQASALETYAGKSKYANHGQRVVEGQRLMQSASDIFLGWERAPMSLDGVPYDFYGRQLWDWKISAEVESMSPEELTVYGKICGWILARDHARSGDRIAIAAYLGGNDVLDRALVDFAVAYADQNERDFQALKIAVDSGRVKAVTGI